MTQSADHAYADSAAAESDADAETTARPGASVHDGEPIRVLLVEDDDGDAYLVRELLSDADPAIRVARVGDIAAARHAAAEEPRLRCVLLDLNLPDASDLEGLAQMLELLPDAAVIVLTGIHDVERGMQAVAAGAQDFLNKGEVDGPLLARAIRYAVERQESHRFRARVETVAREGARLQRGLLPELLLGDSEMTCHATYRPGSRRSLLGGDFYDVIVMPDGALYAVIGDVCGHGPDEAALGVELRVAWRTLTLSGHSGPDVLAIMQRLLARERRSEEVFATVCTVRLAPDLARLELLSAGHPPPLLFRGRPVYLTETLLDSSTGTALGLDESETWATHHSLLPPGWSIMLYTDGLIEGRVGQGPQRLGTEGLERLLRNLLRDEEHGDSLLRTMVAEVERLNEDALADDLAVLVLERPEASPS